MGSNTPPTIHSDPVIKRILGLDGHIAPSTVAEAQGAYQADPRSAYVALLCYLPNAERPAMLSCLRRHIAVVGSMCRAAAIVGDLEAVSRYKVDLRHAAQAVLDEWINKMEVEGKPQPMSMPEYLGYGGKFLPFAAAVVDGVDLRGPITSEAWHQVWHATQGTIGDYVGCQVDRGRAYFMPPGARGALPYTLREWLAARGVDCSDLGVVS